MNGEEIFDKLPNITKNIEAKMRSMREDLTKEPLVKQETDFKNKIFKKMQMIDTFNQIGKSISENYSMVKDSMIEKNKEISRNFDNFIKKIEKETLAQIQNIEKSNLSETGQKEEYQKCIEELDNIVSLSENLFNCVDKSERNIFSFINEGISLYIDQIDSFLLNKEKELNESNLFQNLNDNQKYTTKVFNNLESPNIKNYMITSKEYTNDSLKLNKLTINKFSDLQVTKKLLLNKDNKGELVQSKIKKISINDITQKEFLYLFNCSLSLQRSDRQTLMENKTFRAPTAQFQNEIMEKISIPPTNKLSSKLCDPSASAYSILVDESTQPKPKHAGFNSQIISIKNCNLIDINLAETFAQANKLKLCSCQLSFNFYDIIKDTSFPQMTELLLEDCNLVNENFNEIIFAIISNETLRKNLKYLSFRNNNLTSINFYKYVLDGNIKGKRFEKLDVLDLSYNNINTLDNKTLNGLPIIKNLDLSYNNLQFPDDISTLYEKYKKLKKQKAASESNPPKPDEIPEEISTDFFFQLAGNICIYKGKEHNKKYLDYILEVLSDYKYPLRSINLGGIFRSKKNHEFLSQISLSQFQDSLVEINLSFCNLGDEELKNLLLNKIFIKNVRKINVSNNKLTDKIFDLLFQNNMYDIYTKLRKLDLSNNQIHLLQNKSFKNFTNYYDCIRIVVIKNTPAEEYINSYVRKKIIRFNEVENGGKAKTEFNQEEMAIKDLIDIGDKKEDLDYNQNIKLKMKNTIDYKFVAAAKQIYPELFKKIIIENKYKGPN